MNKQEKRSSRVGAITSITLHALLLLIFFFASGYRAPYPPAPEYGVIVNVGFDDQGTGDIQTDQPVSNPDVEEQKPEEQKPVEPETQKPEEQKDDDQILASKEESPVTVKKEEEKPKEKPKEEIKPKELPKEEKPKEQLKTEYKPDAQPANNNKGTSTTSEGDDENKTGNKGQPNGTLDPNGQYTGKPGGGGGGNGFGLSMSGWGWDEQPKLPVLPDNEDGRIEFEIECDADGEIIGIKTLQRGLSPKAEQLLKEEILRHSLVKNSGGAAPATSKGRVVFILKTR
ncbi:MAG: cell envelope integrity protein TolA [Bacteroidota bacterium]